MADDRAEFDAWLATMTARYELRSRQSFPIRHYGAKEQGLIEVGRVELYEFVPKAGNAR